MGTALRDMLPYTIGLLVSPLPIVAVFVLLAGRNGTRKGLIFIVTWWLVSFVAVLVLALLAGAASRPASGAPVWESALKIIMGAGLLVLAAIRYTAMRQGPNRHGQTLDRLGGMPPDRLAGVAALLLLADPIKLSMLLGAALALGARRLSAFEDLLPAALFALIGSVTMILPLLLSLARRTLPPVGGVGGVDMWLLRYQDRLDFAVALGFGFAFLVSGLRALP